MEQEAQTIHLFGAEGLSTRRYSAGRTKLLPSSKSISSVFASRFSRISLGWWRLP